MKIFSVISRGLLILASACLALACSKLAVSTAPNASTAMATPNPAVAVPAAAPTQNPEDLMPRIRPEEAKKLVDEGKGVIIDVRGTEAYKISHIKGALDYPLGKVEAGDFSGLPKNKRIIAYCT